MLLGGGGGGFTPLNATQTTLDQSSLQMQPPAALHHQTYHHYPSQSASNLQLNYHQSHSLIPSHSAALSSTTSLKQGSGQNTSTHMMSIDEGDNSIVNSVHNGGGALKVPSSSSGI